MNNTPETPQLHWISKKEIAKALDCSPGYVSAMIVAGFKPDHPPDYYTVEGALHFLRAHPNFTMRTAYPSKKGGRRQRSQRTQRAAKGGKAFGA